MANIPRTLPFSSWDEWITVKNGLYALDIDKIHHALALVSMWRLRGRLPLAIDSTANLVELRLRDSGVVADSKPLSENEIKLHFSSAVVRVVNGLVDPGQQGIYATSVLTLAERIGLPGWIVELRHDATHNQLPSLSVLRSAANTLFNWLFDYYWAPQFNLIQSLSASSLPLPPQAASSAGLKAAPTANVSARSTSLQDSSSTYLSEIFIPMFMGTTICSPNLESNSRNAKFSVEKEFSQQKSMWEGRLKDLATANPQAPHLLIIGALAAVQGLVQPDTVLRDTAEEVVLDARLGVAALWVDQLLSLAGPSGADTISTASTTEAAAASKGRVGHAAWRLTARFVGTAMMVIVSAGQSGGKKKKIADLDRVVKAVRDYYRLDPGPEPAPVSVVATASRGTGEVNGLAKDSVLGKRKVSAGPLGSAEGLCSVFRDASVQPWPLGCVPGAAGCGDLCLISDALQ